MTKSERGNLAILLVDEPDNVGGKLRVLGRIVDPALVSEVARLALIAADAAIEKESEMPQPPDAPPDHVM